MFNKTLLVACGNASLYLYLFLVIGYVETERKKLEKDSKAYKALQIKHESLLRTFEKSINLLTAEDQRKVIDYANNELAFIEITKNVE